MMTACAIAECESPARARGWCSAHYQRWQRWGDPVGMPSPSPTTCDIDGCDRPVLARGWCSLHYQRWLNHGDPEHQTRTRIARRLNARGYVLVWAPTHPCAFSTGYVLEHRRVWHDSHGPIPIGHHVHHLNGDKADNRLANLAAMPAREHHQEHARRMTTPCIACGADDWYYAPPHGHRRCRECARQRDRRHRESQYGDDPCTLGIR